MKRHYGLFGNTLILIGVLIITHLPVSTVNAQEKIEEELFRKDSLIKRIGRENIDTSYTYQWNNDSSRWEFYGRDIRFYRANQKLLANLKQQWQPEDQQYLNTKRTIKSYNERGKVVESLKQEWDTVSNDWINLELKTITYDNLGEKSEILYQQWKLTVGRWVNTKRYLIAYNRRGEKSNIVIKKYHPEIDSWSNYQRYLFRYDDGLGPPDQALVQQWDSQSDQWDRQGLYSMHYNFRGQKTIEERATWNESLRRWINGLRYEFSYKKGLKTSEILQRWDYGTRQWYNTMRKKYRYNENKNLKEELTYRWNQEGKEWVIKNRLRFSQKKPEVDVKPGKGESDQS